MIGLLTPFMVTNYGTKLQAYAVQESIRELGFDAQIVNSAPRGEKTTAGNFVYKCVNRAVRMRYTDKRNVEMCSGEVEQLRKRRAAAIHRFDGEYLNLSDEIPDRAALSEYGRRCEAVVCGSDQIWNPYNVGSNFYMLEWAGDARKVAYSPSFGVDSVPWILKGKYVRELKKFHGISVREESGRALLENLGFPQAEHTLDPTLVVSRGVWQDMAERGRECAPKGYVMCYFLGGLSLGRELARAVADRTGLPVVNLPHMSGRSAADEWLDAEYPVYDAGVPEFVRLIRDAEYVVTDSFHATVFSAIFHRPFFSVSRHGNQRYSTNTRLASLLGMLGLEDRMCADVQSGLDRVDRPVDFGRADEALERRARRTREYLLENLGR